MTTAIPSSATDALESFEAAGARELLLSGLWGFEREALRVDGEGRPSEADHPFSPERDDITVDFAENQVELVTKPRRSLEEALTELRRLNREAYAGIGEELLWPLSVPGRWDYPERLRPASFGGLPDREGSRSYRRWLLERYGAARQAITGLHYNFSLSGEFWEFLRRAERSRESPRSFSDRRYMDIARNFSRYRFLPIFLLSASPSIDPRFVDELARWAQPSSRAIGAACAGRLASLRLGPLGYRLDDSTERSIDVRFDSLAEYIDKIEAAVSPSNGDAPLLRSESEFYAPVRPKAAFEGRKASLSALTKKGIEYLELRIFDLDPFEALGIGIDAARFTHLMVLACLFMPSPLLERGVASDDALSLAASSCSLSRVQGPRTEAIAKRVRREAAPLFRVMSRVATLLPPQFGASLDRWEAVISGRIPRSVERFETMAAEMGGLAAGLELARLHKKKLIEAQDADAYEAAAAGLPPANKRNKESIWII